jgi:GNAT superfamily N-acetyltransferase
VKVLRVEPGDPAARGLLAEHAREMARRYGGDGTWEGVAGRKDALWLASADDVALGVIALRVLDCDRVEVKHLYVVPTVRRTGLAAALMDALEADARARGAASIVLETGTAQPEALALYAARGYHSRGPYPECEFQTPTSRYFELDL